MVYADTGERQREVTERDAGARRRGVGARSRRARHASRRCARPISGRCRDRFASQRPLTKFSWPRRRAGLRRLRVGRSGAVHDAGVAPWRLPRADSALALLHPAAQASARLGPRRHLVVRHRHDCRDARHRRRDLDVASSARRIPYRGQKRWHTIIGLIFGLGAVTWAFSGMLSMDPLPALTARPPAGIPQALRGRLELAPFAAKHPSRGARRSSSAISRRSWSWRSWRASRSTSRRWGKGARGLCRCPVGRRTVSSRSG